MTVISGVKVVICTCGKEMERTGGYFSRDMTKSTYYCSSCSKGVNVIDLKDFKPTGELNES